MGEYYRAMERSFWTHRNVRPLQFELKAFISYFMYNEHDHISGIYRIPIPYICHDLGLKEEIASGYLQQVMQAGRLMYDFVHSVVWVPSMFERQLKGLRNNEKVLSSVQKKLWELQDSGLISNFLKRYQINDLLSPLPSPLPSPLEAPCCTPVSVSVTVPVSLRGDSKGGKPKKEPIDLDQWAPKDKHQGLATKRGIDIEIETEKFRNFAKNKRPPYKDLDAAFSNWLLNEQFPKAIKAREDVAW